MIERFYIPVGDVSLNVRTILAGGTRIIIRIGTLSIMKASDYESDITDFVINKGSFQFGGYPDSLERYATWGMIP